MQTSFLPGIELKVPLLGFGCMRLPTASSNPADIDEALAQSMVDRAMEAGVNYFDTARPYHEGNSEPFIGRALKKYPRDSYYLASKLPIWEVKQPEDVERLFNLQLERCGVDYFDFYLVHNLNKRDYDTMVRNFVYGQLLAKKNEGKIRFLGFSFHDEPYLLEEICHAYEWDFAQIQLNYMDWKDIEAESLYNTLIRRKIPAIIMEPVRGGALATLSPESATLLKNARPDASLASWALRFAAGLPGVLTVLSGMSSPEQLEDNIKTFSDFEPLTEDETRLLQEAAAIYRSSGEIPCTACGYCTPCPFKVDIPRVIGCYNHYLQTKNWVAFDSLYCTMPNPAKAHSCTRCGLCLPKCPQALPIPDLMEKIGKFAEEIAQNN
ncbi:MAG: aldo/keto reductase [Desulfovibrionaceae bacterium]|nr:aldo/keto reductase [Desulfovibrionaceae bacterium]